MRCDAAAGQCSAECGEGVETRRVFCGECLGVESDALCDADRRPDESRPCHRPTDNCTAAWFTGPWTQVRPLKSMEISTDKSFPK